MGRERIQIVEEPITASLAEYARVPIAFMVEKVLDVRETEGGPVLSERKIAVPYVKDYDRDEHPTTWSARFDLSKWGLLAAVAGEQRVGGAIIAVDTPGLAMLDGRTDLAVLWDIRVLSGVRRKGIGSALFREVERWARARSCREVRVETQNTNVTACRFYQRLGCALEAVNRRAYLEMPEEIQLLWHKRLEPESN
jgi:ribosomal protein S18 acetylase RimI-like enzyme